MSKKTSTLSLSFLVLFIYLASVITIKNGRMLVYASSSTLKVPDDYLTIQEAINNASPGDIVFVRSGTYHENIVIDKGITLIGENRVNTILDGQAAKNVVSIKASHVTIAGFTIKNSNLNTGCGISIERFGDALIYHNNLVNNNVGIQIAFSCRNQIFENNISVNCAGIQLLYGSSDNAIYRNIILNNIEEGVGIYYNSVSNSIYENSIYGNKWGIYLYGNDNIFYHNNFVSNFYHVFAEQTSNAWCHNGEGNYWDNYRGEDLNKDGIGDIPYNIIGDENKDYYPLMGKCYVFTVPLKGEKYYVTIISNSTVFNFGVKIAPETKSRIILFNASINGYAGFSRVVVPDALMKNVHSVLINGNEVNVTLLDVADAKNAYLYIEYSGESSIAVVYSELLEELNSLNATYNVLIEKFNALNETLRKLLEDYIYFQKEMGNMNLYYQKQIGNFKGLTYIFAAMTATFIITTIYLSKIAYEKQGR